MKKRELKVGPHADICSTRHAQFITAFGKPVVDFILFYFIILTCNSRDPVIQNQAATLLTINVTIAEKIVQEQ